MLWMGWFAIAAGAYPLIQAWRASRRTTLRDAVLWAAAAWLNWGFALTHPENDDLGYLALCLTGCAGVAVFGARRPQVFAWNFVVLGLALVMTLPLLEGMVIQVSSFNIERKVFLAAILLVALGNYAATRFVAAALAVGAVCVAIFVRIAYASDGTNPFRTDTVNAIVGLALGAAPWLAWRTSAPVARDRLEAEWLAFRDRYGFVWSARVREQFNAAAKNAGLPVRLGWNGRLPVDFADARAIEEGALILDALTKRFELEIRQTASDVVP